MRDEVLVYPGLHGTAAVCHLLTYAATSEPEIVIVGNFDDDLGTSTTNAIEVLATCLVKLLGADAFRLIEWYPRSSVCEFTDVKLTPVDEYDVAHGGATARARFATATFAPLAPEQIAELIGADQLAQLQQRAGTDRGEYTAEAACGASGARIMAAVKAANDSTLKDRLALLGEWLVS